MNKRKYTRVPFETTATIRGEFGSCSGAVENLCLSGMFLQTEQKLAQGDKLDIKILLSAALPEAEDPTDEIAISIAGTVVRSCETGLAIEFVLGAVDLESLTHLRYIVANNSGDEDAFLREYSYYLDSRSPKGPTK